MSEQDDNRLYIKIYADDEPSRKAEKLYQICGETENQEVAQWLKEYFPSVDRPTGEWRLNSNGHWQCSKCGAIGNIFDDFCRYCGAKMLDMDYQRAIEQVEHDMTYEPTYNSEDGSL